METKVVETKVVETKVYTVEVVFWNEVKDEEDIVRYVAFAKTIAEIEELAKKDAGENYLGIRGIQHMAEFEPLMD